MVSNDDKRKQLDMLMPTVKSEGGTELGCYLPLLHLTRQAPECFEMFSQNLKRIANIEDGIVILLKEINWRAHLAAAAYLLITKVSSETRKPLWDAIDRGSWVCPQLAVTAYLKDEQFTDLARERLKAAAIGKAFTHAKALSSLIMLCKRMDSSAVWLADLLNHQEINSFILQNDHERGHYFAEGWLYRLKSYIQLPVEEPEPLSLYSLCRSESLTELYGKVQDEHQEPEYLTWLIRVAWRKAQRVLFQYESQFPKDERLSRGLSAIEEWLNNQGLPDEATIQDIEGIVYATASEKRRAISREFALETKWAIHEGVRGNFAHASTSAVLSLLQAIVQQAPWTALTKALLSLEAGIAASGTIVATSFPEAQSHYVDAPSDHIHRIVRRTLSRGAFLILTRRE